MSSKKRLSDVTAVVDDRQEVCLPLDYSFKAVSSFSGEWGTACYRADMNHMTFPQTS